MFESGQTVNIYQKPLTGEKYEGRAMLVEQYRPDEGDGLSMWIVQFDGDDGTYLRTVNEANAKAE